MNTGAALAAGLCMLRLSLWFYLSVLWTIELVWRVMEDFVSYNSVGIVFNKCNAAFFFVFKSPWDRDLRRHEAGGWSYRIEWTFISPMWGRFHLSYELL